VLNPVWLRTLRAVIELGSFADAARQLGYTPSAVSQQMSRLERSIDTPLFKRDRRGIVSTPAAIRLAERATPLLDMLANLDLSDDAAGTITQLRIGICAGGLRYARRALRQLAEDGTQVALSMTTGESTQLVDQVNSGALDVAVVCRYNLVPRIWPGQLASWPLADEPLAVLVRSGHPVAGQPSATLTDVRNEWWITGPKTGDDNSCLLRSCAAAGFEPRVVARVQDRDTARELVLAGVGVTLVPAGADPPDESDSSPGVVSVPLIGPTFRRIEVVHIAADRSAATAAFVAGLRHGPPGDHLPMDEVAR
jgi:DNA-binding transcriptional LysR family regulator